VWWNFVIGRDAVDVEGSGEDEPVSGNEDVVGREGEGRSEVGGVVLDVLVLEVTEEEDWEREEGAKLDVVEVLSVEEYELELDDRSIEADVDDLVEARVELEETGGSGTTVCDDTLLDVLGMIGLLIGEGSGTETTTWEVITGEGMVSGSWDSN
jgi:hypothetical protein